jgi:predicted amidohydrolase
MSAKSDTKRPSLIDGEFSHGQAGQLPAGWELRAARTAIAPVFRLVRRNGRLVLLATGNGQDDCFGYLRTPTTLQGGCTYRLRARFEVSPGLNPHQHLRFCYFADNEGQFNNGIFKFRRLGGGLVEGEGRFPVPGKEAVAGNVRIMFGMSAADKAWIHEVALEPCEPIEPRPVRVAATRGNVGLAQWSRVLDAAGRGKADLVLLPETINGHMVEGLRGPTGGMMAAKAKQYGMYVAGGLYYRDRKAKRVYNACLLFDRKGRLVGRHDKNHPYTPELWRDVGVTPGREVEVFQTDFGKVGILICYDSWFTDVTELLALKGAEIVLFPNAGYFRGLMPARASDNCVRFVTSSLHGPLGIWDTAGRDVTDPEADPTNAALTPPEKTAWGIQRRKAGKVEMLFATMDLSQSPSPHNKGGPCMSAPGGRRNRREQVRLLYGEILQETQRWWEE